MHDNKWTHIKVKHQKLIMALNKTRKCPLQKVLCFFLKWNKDVLCYILVTLIPSNTFFIPL